MHEASLLIRIKEGDQSAFRIIYEKYSRKIYYVSIRFGLDKDDAAEIVQDVFVKIWERRHDLRTDLSFNAYLLTITRNFIIKKIRSNVSGIAIRNYVASNTMDRHNDTEDLVVYADLLRLTDAFIESLPEQQREIFKLHKIQHFSAREISEMLDLSIRTVENHLFRANAKLRIQLKSLGIHMAASLIAIFS